MSCKVPDIQAELAFQAQCAATTSVRRTSADVLRRYRELPHWRLYPLECVFHSLGDVRGKTVLDFGCGDGVNSVVLAAYGANVTGMDVSPEWIELARRRAETDGVPASFVAGDILAVDAGSFDIVLCNAVLHHVEIPLVVPRLLACLRPGGLIVITEPIALSPLLRRIRSMLPLPTHGTPSEHPLTSDEFAFVMGQLPTSTTVYFRLLSRAARLLKRTPRWIFRLDRALLSRLPFLSRYASIAVIVGRLPG